MPEYPDRTEESNVSTDSLWEAKGDLAVGVGNDQAVRLPVGSDGTVLGANSTAPFGVNWTTPSGGSGGDAAYIHTQTGAAAIWAVIHNLNKFPAVTVVDTGNNVLFADVHYDNMNGLTISFSAVTSGKAYLN